MKTDRATMENSVEIPWKTGNRTAIRPSNPTSGHTHRGNQNWKRQCTPMFIAALFTISRTWKQPRCLSVDEWIRKLWYIHTREYYSATLAQSCPTLWDPMDCSLPGSSVRGTFQARILEWGAISFSRGSSPPRDWNRVSCIIGRRFTVWATREVQYSE